MGKSSGPQNAGEASLWCGAGPFMVLPARAMHHFVAIPPVIHGQPDSGSAVPHPNALPEHTQAIKRWTHELLKLDEEAIVTVSEFACSDPGCPLLETVIGVFEPARSRTWRLTRPRVAVTKMMVQQTLAAPPAEESRMENGE